MMSYPTGRRLTSKIREAQEQLNYFVELLEGECVKVKTETEFD